MRGKVRRTSLTEWKVLHHFKKWKIRGLRIPTTGDQRGHLCLTFLGFVVSLHAPPQKKKKPEWFKSEYYYPNYNGGISAHSLAVDIVIFWKSFFKKWAEEAVQPHFRYTQWNQGYFGTLWWRPSEWMSTTVGSLQHKSDTFGCQCECISRATLIRTSSDCLLTANQMFGGWIQAACFLVPNACLLTHVLAASRWVWWHATIILLRFWIPAPGLVAFN